MVWLLSGRLELYRCRWWLGAVVILLSLLAYMAIHLEMDRRRLKSGVDWGQACVSDMHDCFYSQHPRKYLDTCS